LFCRRHTHKRQRNNNTKYRVYSKVARSKKIKRPNLAISSFKKGQILKNEKRPNKGLISPKKIVKTTKLKFRIS